MRNIELIALVLLGGMGAILGAVSVCGFVWVVVDRCEDFSKSNWERVFEE